MHVDITALPPGVQDELIKGRHAKDALTILKTPRRQEIQARLHAAETPQVVEGLGVPTMCIEAGAYHYWGQRLGYACWKDKQFLREFKRDNESVRLNVRGGTRIQSGYRGGSAPGAVNTTTITGTKFRKVYG
jgi:hypothetical protein